MTNLLKLLAISVLSSVMAIAQSATSIDATTRLKNLPQAFATQSAANPNVGTFSNINITTTNAYSVGGNVILKGDGSNTALVAQNGGTVYVQSTDLTKTWAFQNNGTTTVPGLIYTLQGISAAAIQSSDIKVSKIPDPSAPTVSAKGTTGSTGYTYYAVCKDYGIGGTNVSPLATIANGNAVLNSTNYNLLTANVSVSCLSVDWLRGDTAHSVVTGWPANVPYKDIGGSLSGYTAPTRNTTSDIVVQGEIDQYGEDAGGINHFGPSTVSGSSVLTVAGGQTITAANSLTGLPTGCQQLPCTVAGLMQQSYSSTASTGYLTLLAAGSVVAGSYEICEYMQVSVAGTAGTFQGWVSYTSAGHSTPDTVTSSISTTTQWNHTSSPNTCQEFHSDSGVGISYQWVASGVTGTPTIIYNITLTRKK